MFNNCVVFFVCKINERFIYNQLDLLFFCPLNYPQQIYLGNVITAWVIWIYHNQVVNFVFSKEGEYQKITYHAPSFSSLIDVFLEKTEEIEASSRVDQDDINSYAEKIRDLAEIQNGDVSFLFNDAGLHQMSFDIVVTFNETKAKERFADAPFYPCDDMVFKADIVMLEGEDAEPLVLSNARKASYVAYDLDKLDKIFDKFRPKSESEENSQE